MEKCGETIDSGWNSVSSLLELHEHVCCDLAADGWGQSY